MKFENIIIILFVLGLFSSCEDVITVNLEEGNNQLVVDAWINNLNLPQTIILSRTSPYFDASPSTKETGATVVVVEDDGTVYNFEDADNDGAYSWMPDSNNTFGRVGGVYKLSITTSNGKEYSSISAMNRIMPIDTITLEDKEEELGQVAGIYAELFARDFLGEGDAYWIKSFKNGKFLNKPQEMNIVWDASFNPGSGVDGVIFISPIRQFINRIADSEDGAIDNSDLPPWAIGDSIRVEIHSLNQEAFLFLEQALTQMTLGDAGIFAEPPANVPTNIESINVDNASDKAIGFFNISAVSSNGRIVKL